MHKWLVKWGIWFSPIIASILIYFGVYVLQELGGFQLPEGGVTGLAVLVGVVLFGYLLQLKLLNRIGGLAVVLVASIILAGTLLPKETIVNYPDKASESASRDFDAAWKALYGKNLFKEFSFHENMMQYLESLSSFDVHRAGQVGLFGAFGLALGVCFLFPIDPSRRLGYWGRVLLLLSAGLLWSLQTELLQVMAPSRIVSFVDFMESLIGVSAGILVFALLNIAFVLRKKVLEDRRFNILGVGIDAVNMQDCLDLFEEIIQGTPNNEHGISNAEGEILPAGKNTTDCKLNAESSYSYPSQDETGSLDLGDNHQEARKRQQPDTLTLSSGLTTRLPAMTTAMGVAGIVESRRNQTLQRILNESVLNTPDGMPLVWLGKWAGYRGIERVYGPDLLRDACAYGEDKKWRHYFWGAAPGIVEKLKVVLEEKHPKIEISGICCPPFRPLTKAEEDELVEEVNSSNTDIFWIGISTPKQLYFMDHIRDRLKCKIICPVGYAFDVNAGVEKDAPDWVKYSGLQWLHRGIKQPRLWKRYLPDNPMFVLKVVAQKMHLKKFPMFLHDRALDPYRDQDGFPRFPAGVVSISAVTLSEASKRIRSWVRDGAKKYVNICSATTVVESFDDPDLAKIIMESDAALAEDMPLVWLAKRYGFSGVTRVYGVNLLMQLCESGMEDGVRHFFCGPSEEITDCLTKNLLEQFPGLQIAGTLSGTACSGDDAARIINEAKADIVWCGISDPLQNYWVSEFRPVLDAPVLVALNNSFGYLGGSMGKPPAWMMKLGLEWFYLLCCQPRRFGRRYIIGNPRFVFQTMTQWLRARTIRRRMAARQ